LLESEIASLVTALAGSVLTDAWTSVVRPRLVALWRREGRGQDERVLAELEELRSAAAGSAAGDRDGAVERMEELLRSMLGAFLAEQSALAAEVRELRAAATVPAARPPARIAVLLDVDGYENNEQLLRDMGAAWEAGRATAGPTLLFLWGARGVGRTALAERFLLAHRGEFAGGPELRAVLAKDASGRLPDPMAVLEGWFHDLHVPAQEVPADPAARVREFRHVTAEGPVFVLLEDATLASQIDPLLPDSPDGLVVITSTAPMRDLVVRFHAKPFKVKPLERPHSRSLLVNAGGLAAYQARHERAIGQVLDVCQGNPLFLRIAAAQMVFDLPHSIEDFAAALSDPDPGARLGAFDMDDRAGAELFGSGYRELRRRAPDAALIYRCVGLHPTPEFDADVVRAMVPGLGDAARTKALRALMDVGLAERVADDTYRMAGGLVHAHAAESARADMPREEREAVKRRWIQYYVDLVERYDAGLSPRYRYDPAGAYAAYPRVGQAEQDAVVADLTRRRQTLLIAVRTAYEAGRADPWAYEAAWRMPQGMWTFLMRCGFHTDWIELYEVACEAALECGDLLALARMRYGLGFAHLDRWSVVSGDPPAAREQFEQALDLVRPRADRPEGSPEEREGRRRTWSSVLEGLGILERKLGNASEALGHFAAARAALDGIDHPRGLALIALHRGPVHTLLGRYDEAAAELLSAEEQFLALSDTFNAAKARARYGEARLAAGHPAQALASFDQAVAAMSHPRDAHTRAQVLLTRGDLLRERGELPRARTDWTEAAGLFRAVNSSSRAQEADRRLADWPAPDGTDDADGSDTSDGSDDPDGTGATG